MLYGVKCWPKKREHIQQMSVTEMRMLRWMCDHTIKDRIRNEGIGNKVGTAPIEEKIVKHRVRWFGHIQRRPVEAPVNSSILKNSEKLGGVGDDQSCLGRRQ